MTFFWIGKPVPRAPLIYSAGIVILGQGHKVGYLADRRFEYGAESCLVLGIPVPFECESYPTPDEPLLGIRIDIDLGAVHRLVAQFAGKLGLEKRSPASARSGVEPLAMEGALLTATARLLESLQDPMDRQVVGPAAVDEIFYRVLRSDKGRVLYDLTQHQTPYSNVAQALDRIHRDYRESLTVEELARESAMGVSSFHRAFKEITGDSPVQYVKKIRLLKAKGLLVFEGKQVSEAAYEVGYASPSQFSREFKRYFQVPPSEAETLPYNDAA
ncbi:MAG: AraC family transcriptional regulator [Acidobacteriota bacterium]|nr:AraC family transcriptional regulator [Acidobacteriota bacterium]